MIWCIMAKILYINDSLHKRLKLLAIKLGISMQDATEKAIGQWLDKAEEEEKMQQILLNRIESKLSQEERSVLAAILAKKGTQDNK
jgi:hypothetical protein